MALSNAQYDAMMRAYEERRVRNRHIVKERREKVYGRIPELKAIDSSVANLATEQAKRYVMGEPDASSRLHVELTGLAERKRELLEEYGFPADYLAEIYDCPACKDTGYINGKKCKCLKREIIRMLYRQSNLDSVLAEENFDNLSYEYYNDSDVEEMRRIVGECRRFAEQFDTEYKNLLLYGDVGVGKTYLTNCIARELLETGHSVIYFTSFQLFDTLAQGTFGSYDAKEEAQSMQEDIFGCDLLIIDDLGTEMMNSFVSSQLFRILNERNIRQKSTLISTNLSLEHLNERYSERSFSRIFGFYQLLWLKVDDLRMKKKRAKTYQTESEA